ncbi:MAG: B12-binding domain-containing radical SAM protein, partial [Gemmataceae bacterium]
HELKLPYALYDSEDIAHRVIYVEASRGCPFTCEFCLSSLEIPVRAAPLEQFLAEMDQLLKRGTRQFKFVDRTFNLNTRVGITILHFFLDRMQPDLFLHFEMIPDRLPEELKSLIRRFPAGSLQFEVGIQSFNPEVQALISRRQDHAKTVDNLRWLRENTTVHIHADLIAGLPGETMESFGKGFDTLRGLGPQEIQVGILKRLRGTPIIRHDAEWEMVYSPQAPY